MLLSILQAADDALGRVDFTTLSDQTRMELFMEGFTHESKKPFQNPSGEFLDIQEWDGLTFDDQGALCEMKYERSLEGTVAFEFTPASVERIGICKCSIEGTLDVTRLPDGLTSFIVTDGKALRGTIDLCSLPSELVHLYVSQNQFHGSADLTQLPDSLLNLNLSSNKFSGTLSLKSLPAQMWSLELHDNNFSGSLDISNLPRDLFSFNAGKNQFTGNVRFTNLPPDIEYLVLDNNKFEGELNVTEPLEFIEAVLDEADLKYEVTCDDDGFVHDIIRMSYDYSGDEGYTLVSGSDSGSECDFW